MSIGNATEVADTDISRALGDLTSRGLILAMQT